MWWDFERDERVDGPNANLCLLVAEAGNPRHRDEVTRLHSQRMLELKAGGELAAKAVADTAARALARSVLLGWANMLDDDGAEIAYSEDKAFELLSDPAMWPLRARVIDYATNSREYMQRMEADAKGN